MGSIARVIPGRILSPVPRPAEVRDLRRLVHRDADAVADHVADDAESVALDVGLDRG